MVTVKARLPLMADQDCFAACTGQSSLAATLSGRSSMGGWVEGVKGKIAGLQEALEASQVGSNSVV